MRKEDLIDNRGPVHSIDPSRLMLWYRKPAEQWLEALPIGNGRTGAMIYGGMPRETIQLNEGTLWAGGPHCYDNLEAYRALPEIRQLVVDGQYDKAQTLIDKDFLGVPAGQAQYQPVGSLHLDFEHSGFTDFRRSLDLTTAVAKTRYKSNGMTFKRQAFASHPANVIVVKLSSDQTEQISFSATYTTPQSAEVKIVDEHTIALIGVSGRSSSEPGAVGFTALSRLFLDGGKVVIEGNSLRVVGANTVTVLIGVGTSYINYQDVSGDHFGAASNILDTVTDLSFNTLLADHLTDYQPAFKRFSLSLGVDSRPDLPTDERIAGSTSLNDPDLAALFCQYGRYLLLSSSRKGGQPANLQGLWNDSMFPPWDSKYTVNINTEMNYWPSLPGGLPECLVPLFGMIADLSVTGALTAKRYYGSSGWVCHHNTDGWRGSAPVDRAFHGMWQSGGAWLCKSIWDHYEFTQDKDILAKLYPLMKGAATFFLETLVADPTDTWLVTNPSSSPENAHHEGVSVCAGPSMDCQIIRDLLDTCVLAAEELAVDSEFRSDAMAVCKRLPPLQIGKQGQLQEWLNDWDSEAPEQDHRHVSHLYALYPGCQITRKKAPEMFAAAKKSLETRGDESTGWAMAWRINLWARLEEGEHALKLIEALLTPERTAPNMFDLHPPFQIDGNFGGSAGIMEMLVQSHSGEITLLPALPSAWNTGAVSGLRTRGGFEIDMAWSGGRIVDATLKSHTGTKACVTYENQTEVFILTPQATIKVIENGRFNTSH